MKSTGQTGFPQPLFTAQLRERRPRFGPLSTVEAAEYLAANLVFEPLPRLSYGIEYLYGSRTDKDSAQGEAHRLQFSVRYDLP